MIRIRDHDGRTHYIAPSAIARVTTASNSQQYHGIRAVVYLTDGTVIESRGLEDAAAIAWQVECATKAQAGQEDAS